MYKAPLDARLEPTLFFPLSLVFYIGISMQKPQIRCVRT